MARGSVNTGYAKHTGDGINLTTSLIEAYRVAGDHNITAGDFVEFINDRDAELFIELSDPMDIDPELNLNDASLAALDDNTFIVVRVVGTALMGQVFKIENGSLRSGFETVIDSYTDGGSAKPAWQWVGAMSSTVAIVGHYKRGSWEGQYNMDDSMLVPLVIDDVNIYVKTKLKYGYGFGYLGGVEFVKLTDNTFVLGAREHCLTFPGAYCYYCIESFKVSSMLNPVVTNCSSYSFGSIAYRGDLSGIFGTIQKINASNVLYSFSRYRYDPSGAGTAYYNSFTGTISLNAGGVITLRQTVSLDHTLKGIGPVSAIVFPDNKILIVETLTSSVTPVSDRGLLAFYFVSMTSPSYILSILGRKVYAPDEHRLPYINISGAAMFFRVSDDNCIGYNAYNIVKFTVSFDALTAVAGVEQYDLFWRFKPLLLPDSSDYLYITYFGYLNQINVMSLDIAKTIKRSLEKGKIIGVAKESGMEYEVIDIYTL